MEDFAGVSGFFRAVPGRGGGRMTVVSTVF